VTAEELLRHLIAERWGPLAAAERDRPPTAEEIRRRQRVLCGDDEEVRRE
jgi:hypothetical protein